MAEQEMDYQEVLAALPAYATKILNEEKRAAVDAYLQRQIALFQRLDALEEATEQPASPAALPAATSESQQPAQEADGDEPFTRVMEGHAERQQLQENPLLMRKSPRSYRDSRTGQRFVIPRRDAQRDEAARPYPMRAPSGRERVRRALWNLLAVAAVIAVLIISASQLQLQRQLTVAEAQMKLLSDAERIVLLRDATGSSAMQGTIALHERRALLVLTEVDPLADGQIYQLWLTTGDGKQHAIPLMNPAEVQRTWQHAIDLPVDAVAVTAVAVSIEAAGGALQPTAPMLLNGRVRVEE